MAITGLERALVDIRKLLDAPRYYVRAGIIDQIDWSPSVVPGHVVRVADMRSAFTWLGEPEVFAAEPASPLARAVSQPPDNSPMLGCARWMP